MLSYRHSFHAGNHADVFKHVGCLLILNKLCQKNKPFSYIDTHSGAGIYALDSDEAQKTAEYKAGIQCLRQYHGNNPSISEYIKLTNEYLSQAQYPGSPELAKRMLREQDKMVLMEWHNSEIDNLRRNVYGHNVACHHRDGFEGLIALTPPNPARGMVLIDPSYEMAEDYQQVVSSLSKALCRWSRGIYVVWYPILSARAGSKQKQQQKMLQKLAQLPADNILQAELMVVPQVQDIGMQGSGLVILNAPWQLDNQLQDCITELFPILAQPGSPDPFIQWLKQGC